ncbi:hypothetical protein Y032_0387g480 [Ancylostoma ceylanicum]|uniref:Uncharacterized protein n=2 Tax=Ancylostoma ceylanicum TaxID=53326 RepID=A0A016RSF6_9BILA|nr:hypothetical protein Y032_0387g480 [Ancylostoma ceylanicum]
MSLLCMTEPSCDILQKYECALEHMAKNYVTEHGYLLPSLYGVIHVPTRGGSIDNKLDDAFKYPYWERVKEGLEVKGSDVLLNR